jgi:hypothetical protein
MHGQSYFGFPKKCYNRKCRAPFYKESHLGHLPKNELEIFAVLKCHTCDDTFAVVQPMSMAGEFYKNLPARPTPPATIKPITLSEMRKMSRYLDRPNALGTVFDGLKPGAAGFTTRVEIDEEE